MPDSIRVMIQMHQTAAMAVAAFGPVSASPHVVGISDIGGVQVDSSYSPVPIPPTIPGGVTMAPSGIEAPTTYVVRASVTPEALPQLLSRAKESSAVIGVFSDPKIEPIATCPGGPVGTDLGSNNCC